MLIFDKAYIEVRNKYIHPLSNYTLQYRHLNTNNIKNILLSKVQNVIKVNSDEYVFDFNEKDLIKAILGDIFLFYIKDILQKNDFDHIVKMPQISANWNIVTYYYKAFFASSLLLRLCFRGNIFFDSEYKKNLEHIISTHIGEVIKIDSKYIYYIEKNNSSYQLKIKKSQHQTHELVWEEMDQLLKEIVLLANKNSDEKTFLQACLEVNKQLGNKFPSQLRNKVNYQPLYGMKAVNKEIYCIRENEKWIREIISFNGKDVKDNENHIANILVAYSIYIEKFAFRLIQDYFEMLGREDYILTNINKEREDKIIIPEISFVY